MSVGAVNKQTGERIPTAGMPAIDDALDLTSVNPVQNAIVTAALANKQDKTDNNLQTTDKTIPGAINELKSGLTNVQADVKLNTNDLTTPSRTKNLLPMTLSGIKSANTAGTWSGNVYTIDTMSFTIKTDNDNNVVSILLNGSTSSSIILKLCSNSAFLSDGNYILTDGITDASSSLNITVYKNNNWLGSTASGAFNLSNVVSTDLFYAGIYVNSNAGELTDKSVYPMIRLATETNATFAPYIPSVESRIEAVHNDLTDLDSESVKYIRMPGNDGQHYSRTIDFMQASRFGMLILVFTVNGYVKTIGVSVDNQNGVNDIYFSDNSASYDKTTKTITVNSGANAWAYPMIYYPSSFVSFV